MSWADGAGLIGVFLMLAAYAAAQIHVLDPVRAPSLAMNLAGACLVILSLTEAFNLSAFLMEGAWALIAAAGLLRVAMSRR
jgi:hypothetical protein